eukprot:7449164-Pyramimonas_sp.AAC.1
MESTEMSRFQAKVASLDLVPRFASNAYVTSKHAERIAGTCRAVLSLSRRNTSQGCGLGTAVKP